MIDEKTADCLVAYFSKLLKFYQEFLELEQNKRKYLEQNKLDRLDECMKQEQAFVLKARGLEQERTELMKKTPQPTARFREIIPLFPSEIQKQVQDLYENLSSILTELKATNEHNKLLAERKLRRASTIVAKLKGQPGLQKIYGEKLINQERPPAFLSKKI